MCTIKKTKTLEVASSPLAFAKDDMLWFCSYNYGAQNICQELGNSYTIKGAINTNEQNRENVAFYLI